jgi:integrase
VPRITKRYVDGLKPSTADVVYWDDGVPGFGIRVRPSGAKSYVFVYRLGGGRRGRLRRLTLGPANIGPADREAEPEKRRKVLAAEEARKAAQKAAAAAAEGGDPAGEKQAQREDLTVAELVERYLSEGPGSRPAKKASSWSSDTSNLKRHALPLLGRRHLRVLTKADIEKFQSDVTAGKTKAPVTAKGAKKRGRVRVQGGPAVAARATAALRAMLTWAVDRKFLKENPASKVKLNKPGSRERFLDDAELARLGEAVAEMEAQGVNPASLTIARLLALTGARKNEIAGLRWRYVDFQRSALILPDSKSGAKLIPLGAPALAVLMAWGEQFDHLGGDRYVFPAERGKGFHVGLPKVWRRLRVKAGLSGVRLHDLRHTHASTGVALNQSLHIVGKILGHRKPETTARYSHLALDPVRAAADQTAQHVAAAMKGRGASSFKVVRLARPK